ncbi:hypothetical protein D3C80_1680570 [compost metagenome]
MAGIDAQAVRRVMQDQHPAAGRDVVAAYRHIVVAADHILLGVQLTQVIGQALILSEASAHGMYPHLSKCPTAKLTNYSLHCLLYIRTV